MSNEVRSSHEPGEDDRFAPKGWDRARRVLEHVGSLNVTVALFALAIFLVFAGTMAQTQMDIWEVVNRYFRCFVARIDLQIFFPPSFFPSKPQVPGWFPFPGGWLIGGLLVVNLAAASALRFPVQARGKRLAAGLGVTLLGLLAIWAVVASGANRQGLHYSYWLNWSAVWWFFLAGLAAAWLASVVAVSVRLARNRPEGRGLFWLLVGTLGVQGLLGVALLWLV